MRVPHVFIPPLREIAEGELGKEVELSLIYEWMSANYRIQPHVGEDLRTVLEVIFEDDVADLLPETLVVASVPAKDTDNVLEHGGLFHEVGHVVTSQNGCLRDCFEHISTTTDDAEDIAQSENPSPGSNGATRKDDLWWTQIRFETRKRLIEQTQHWLWECLSDVWAVSKAGPAPMLALWAVADVQRSRETHPPTWLRWKLGRIALERAGFLNGDQRLEWLQSHVCDIETRIDNHRHSFSQDELEPMHRFLTKQFESAADAIVDTVYTSNSTDIYRADDWLGSHV